MPRGGKREGAGRKTGALTTRTREIAEQATETGKSPLDVMLENMRHFQKVALDAEATLEGLTLEEFTGRHGDNLLPSDQFKALLAEVKKTAGLRQMAQECARDAASYIHPRLNSVKHSGEIATRRAAELSDDELANLAAGSSAGTSEPSVDPTKLN